MFSALLTSTSIVSELVHDAAASRYALSRLLLTYLLIYPPQKNMMGKKKQKR